MENMFMKMLTWPMDSETSDNPQWVSAMGQTLGPPGPSLPMSESSIVMS